MSGRVAQGIVRYDVVRGAAWRTVDRPGPRTSRSADEEAAVILTRTGDQARWPDADVQAEAIWDPVYRSADAQEGPAAFRDQHPPVRRGR